MNMFLRIAFRAYRPKHLRKRSWSFQATSTASAFMFLVGLIPAAAIATLFADPASADTQTFSYTGSVQTYTVPSGVTSIGVDAQGGRGGGDMGGLGSWVHAVVPVTPGDTINVYVGGQGDSDNGGYSGGGGPGFFHGGGGGGASDIRIGGTDLSDRVVAAGGGGGASGDAGSLYGQGGVGGAPNGEAGANGSSIWVGGAGATQSGGAALGDGQDMGCCGSGGAGGGGYYGGYAGQADSYGGSGSGGGGGSSWAESSATDVSYVDGTSTGNGSVVITSPPSTVIPTGGVTDQATYNVTSARQYYRVGEGTTQLGVLAMGGSGGAEGGSAQGLISVAPGQVVSVFPGGQGTDTTAGYNGGGSSTFWGAGAGAGSGGGGASDVRVGGVELTDRALVAGGGGGSATASPGGAGGAGGGLAGDSGGDGNGSWRGGGGGGQSSGGSSGGDYGADGILGLGGDGGFTAGSGGGGYYGGGGGGGDSYGGSPGGGGGGSSYLGSATSASTSAGVNTGDGTVSVADGVIPSGGLAGGDVTPVEMLGGLNAAYQIPQCNTGNPVDCATGDFWHTFNDISIPGRGIPLSLSRTYNSLSAATNSAFGYGWTFNYGMSLNYDSGAGTANISQENGAQVTFTNSGSGTFTAPPRVLASLVHNSDGTWTFTRRAKEIFTFDSSGKLTSEKDLNGYVTTVSYPDSSHITATEPGGRTLSFVLDTNGHITGVTDPAGRTESFTYDSSGNLTDAIDVGGGHWQFTYDSNHQMLTMRSPRFYGDTTTSPSPVVSNVYDSSGRVTSQTDPLGRETTFSYDDTAHTTTITDPKGNVTFEEYQDGILISLTKGYGTSSAATSTYTFDPNIGAVASEHDPDGHVTTFAYDSNGNQTGETDALGHASSATYDGLDDLTASTDANGVTNNYTYDSDGNLLTEVQHLSLSGGGTENETTTYTYGDSSHPGDVTKVTEPMGHATTYTYDTYGDVASSTDGDGNKTTYNYNGPTSIGWVMSQVSAKGNVPGGTASVFTTTYTRDDYGRVLTTKDPDWTSSNPTAHISTNVYDADGNLTSTTDGNGHTTSYTYDAAGELTETTNPDSTTQQTSYYGDGSIHTQTDGNGHVTAYTYDPLGNLSSATDPLSRTTSYDYDGAGNLINKINPGGSCSGTPSGCATYSHDADNRMTGITYSDGTHAVTYGYDNDGNKTSMTDGTGTSSYVYDSLDRLTSQTDGASNTVSYTYNQDSQVDGITYPGSHDVTRGYDNAGHLTSVSDWLGNTDKFTYDPNGNQTSTRYGNDLTSQSIFDQANQLIGISMGKGNTATFAYTRNGNGSLTGTTATDISPSSESFGYDSNNRVNSYNSQSLGYDNAGNMTTTDNGSTVAHDNANEVTSVTPSGGSASTYGYNSEGDRTSAGSNSYSYDLANRMTGFTNGTTTASYAYDGNGQRTSKTVGSTTNNFVYDNAEGTSQILSDGTNDYIYGPNGTPVEQVNGSTVTYLQQDQLGSTRVLTNQSKNVVGTYSYDAYGNTVSHTGTVSTPLEYAGQYPDAESGLYWMRARYFDPTTGLFTTVDPLSAETQDPYGYASENPANGFDANGLGFCALGHNSGGGCNGASLLRGAEGQALQQIHDSLPGQVLQLESNATDLSHGVCLGANGGAVISGSVSVCYVQTPSGDYGFTATVGKGGTTPTIGVSVMNLLSNAQTLDDFRGPFASTSASGGIFPWALGLNFQNGFNRAGCPIQSYSWGWAPSPLPYPYSSVSDETTYTYASGFENGESPR